MSDSSLTHSSPLSSESLATAACPSQPTPRGDGRAQEQLLMQQKERIQAILTQDRQVENFVHYTSRDDHAHRLRELARLAPQLYDNPAITPRSAWFQHARYHDNSQMPPFHIHFRYKLQVVIKSLWQAWQYLSTEEEEHARKGPKVVHSYVVRAQQDFQSCMSGLHGHVRIEEHACFPLYKQTFPIVADIVANLERDHHALHQAEDKVHKALKDTVTALEESAQRIETESSSIQNVLEKTLQIVLDFDDALMAHLGEEEEIVVPLSLTEKPIWF